MFRPKALRKAMDLMADFKAAYLHFKENEYTEERQNAYEVLENAIIHRLERTFQEDEEWEEEWADMMAAFQANANVIKNE